MGLGGISIWQLLIILLIVMLVFGTKRLKSLGGDLGGALKSFRKAMDTDESKDAAESAELAESAEDAKQLGSNTEPDAEFSEQSEKDRQQ